MAHLARTSIRLTRSVLVALTLALVLLAAPLVSTPVSAQQASTQDVETILAGFTRGQFPATLAAVDALAASGHPHAAPILQALSDRRLVFETASRRVLWQEGGQTFDALTGEPVAAPGPTTDVRVSNAVRRAVQTAMASLTLRAPNPATRIEAAVSILRARDLSQRAALAEARAEETDPNVQRAFDDTLAGLALVDPDAPEAERLAAVERLTARADAGARALLLSVPADATDAVKAAAAEGIAAIDRRLEIQGHVQNLFFGLSLGSVLLLAAIGLAITFGVMGVINMAHGEMVMIGAYATFVVQELMRAFAPGLLDLSLLVALPLAFATAGLVGIALERLVIRHLYGRPLETLLATWGVSLILQQAVRTLFGPTNREVMNPSFMSGSLELFGIALTWSRVWIIVFALAVFLALLVAMKATSFGLRMRAVVQNRRMAASMGIRTPWVDALTFGLGSGIAGVAGVALSQIDNVSPNLGQSYIIDSFLVVVFGGVGSLWGALVAALSLGVANKLVEPLAGAVLAKIVILVAVILFIQKRPRGLFALKGRAVES
ncbi:urea ABC transporter permease subunit UrtB [Salinarimonas ramus]|uniref:Branched-chain amino acid ABC transporter permease n=1 Tax=Salinarimonas ramus TaxID=690164 RepID=A0A917Q596_9HYPH|nr:urea ABC transporter permease subunit UrtB [Salinarimonas ramus]GGK26120.1 branched-chain amino acid ABC transporter permease [Salinarimonas ramus]